MVLWIIFALLTALALLGVLWPTLRGKPSGGGSDVAVYRDQLKELEAELARGQIDEAEAEAARIEISRRLLAAGEADSAKPKAGRSKAAKVALARDTRILSVAAIAIPLASVGIYLWLGSPGLPGAPYAKRLAGVESEARGPQAIARLVAQVEARLREEPQDGRGWDVIAPVYVRLGRYGDAADAYSRALKLLGENAKRLEGFGEARALADNGIVGERSRKAFAAALKRDPDLPKSRFWLGIALEQDGKLGEALDTWRALLARAEANAPWRGLVEQRIANAEATLAARIGRGPEEAEGDAASRMSQRERDAMINAMVEGLASRLAEDGDDLQGWLRLTRSYMVLGRREAAAKALSQARANFSGDRAALAQLQSLAKELGL